MADVKNEKMDDEEEEKVLGFTKFQFYKDKIRSKKWHTLAPSLETNLGEK